METRPRRPRHADPLDRRNVLRGWEGYPVDGPINSLVRASAYHLEAKAADNCAPKTLTQYQGRVGQFLTFLKEKGHSPPFSLDLLNIQNIRQAALWIREHSHGPRGGESSARAMVSTCKTWSAFLADEGVIELDGLSRLKRPKVVAISRQPFTQWETRQLVLAAGETMMGSRDVALIHLLLDTGQRIGELTALRLQDIDVKERRMVVHGKGNRERVLYFGTSERRDGGRSVRALKEYLEDREKLLAKWRARGEQRAETDRLWLSYDCFPSTPTGFGIMLKQAARRSGVLNVFPHRFRHTFATMYLVRHPGDETGLRGILGHLSQEMFRVYVHLAHEIIAQRAGRMSLSEVWLGEGDDEGPTNQTTPNPPSGGKQRGERRPW